MNPEDRARSMGASWRGASGLAADVRYYGKWMRDEAWKRIGHLYPKVELPKEQGGGEATVIAWLWARTVKCPNPACGANMPLVSSFALSTKAGRQACIEPIIHREVRAVTFKVRHGTGLVPEPPKTGRGASFRCLVCNQIAEERHIKAEGRAGRIGAQLMAIVAEGARGRQYIAATQQQASVATVERPDGPDEPLAQDPKNIWCFGYGLTRFRDLFTSRQLVALNKFCELVTEVRQQVLNDATAAGPPPGGGAASTAAQAAQYADAIATYLAFAVDRGAESWCSLARWQSTGDFVAGAFSRQALPMLWDFAEVNPFCSSTRNFTDAVEWVAEAIALTPAIAEGTASQADASKRSDAANSLLVCTDPPYYDNVGYADLSDFFYVWLRRMLRASYPDLFATVLTPKSQELVALTYRFDGSADRARGFFEEGLGESFVRMRLAQSSGFPMTVFYAFKQAESDSRGESTVHGSRTVPPTSTGWETMLEGLLGAGFLVTGTWPVRTERGGRMRDLGANALASSILLVCRPRAADAPRTTRRDFSAALRMELPQALKRLQHERIAPVDLDQAAIGPGMAIFSRYNEVLEPDGSPMRIRGALQLIGQVVDEALRQQEAEFDSDTRWALTWFEQRGMQEGPYGDAEVLSKARNVDVDQLRHSGILTSRAGKVKLLARDEFPANWDPGQDHRLSDWRLTQELIRALDDGGASEAGALLAKARSRAEAVRDLAYRLYAICDRKGWSVEAQAYNRLAQAWPDIVEAASRTTPGQTSF